jgi:hypothetical protein
VNDFDTMRSINCQMRHLRNYGLGHALTGSKSLDERKIVPFLITERQDEKQLCISSRSLHVNDFALVKTLGTGDFVLVLLVF